MSNDPLSGEHDQPAADRRSIVDWLSADDDIELVPERLNLLLQPPSHRAPDHSTESEHRARG